MKIYRSKFGYAVLGTLIIFLALLTLFMAYKKEPLEAILATGSINLGAVLFILYLNLSTTYTFTNDNFLHVKCGFLYNKKFNINQFTSIDKSKNLMSSPAPSLDRLELHYGEFGILIISPKNPEEFAKDLVGRNSKIENKVSTTQQSFISGTTK